MEKAQEEINELSDITITFEPIKRGRRVERIRFNIQPKTPLERAIMNHVVTDKLDKCETPST